MGIGGQASADYRLTFFAFRFIKPIIVSWSPYAFVVSGNTNCTLSIFSEQSPIPGSNKLTSSQLQD
jgi:hypothetical protein